MISTSELAKLAGVSQSTVSRCLNDHPSISFETKERIRNLALKYGYAEQKRGKKTLFTGKHRIIGILVDNQSFFDDLFINYTINHLINKAAQKNYYTIQLPISSQEEGNMEKLREFLKLHIIDGFIIMHRNFDEEIHRYLNEIGIPHLYLLRCSRNSFEAVNIVDADNYIGGYLGTKHLLDHGHRNILTLTCPWREFEDRTEGYRQAHLERGLAVKENFILTGECSYISAYNLITEHIHLFQPTTIPSNTAVTAIYTQSDIQATGAINALQHHGLRIPDHVSVVGSGGYELAILSNPPYDSVSHSTAELIDLALSRMMELITCTHQQTPRQILLRPHVIERASVRTL